jgi:hypothetical protein
MRLNAQNLSSLCSRFAQNRKFVSRGRTSTKPVLTNFAYIFRVFLSFLYVHAFIKQDAKVFSFIIVFMACKRANGGKYCDRKATDFGGADKAAAETAGRGRDLGHFYG